jgi:hypothetical protein
LRSTNRAATTLEAITALLLKRVTTNSQVRKTTPAIAINWTEATPILAFLNTFDHLTFMKGEFN